MASANLVHHNERVPWRMKCDCPQEMWGTAVSHNLMTDDIACGRCGRTIDYLLGNEVFRPETPTKRIVHEDRPTDYVTDCPRHAGRVLRYHTWVVHHHQSIGEHCWQMALVYEQIFGELSPLVERHIRHHDTAELVVGDPPFPVKSESPVLKTEYDRLEVAAMDRMRVAQLYPLPEKERIRVKICDLLEMMCHGMTEREMGNMLAVPVVLRTEKVAAEMAKILGPTDEQKVTDWVRVQWVRHKKVLELGDPSFMYNYDNRRKCA